MTIAIGRGVRVEMDFGSGSSIALTAITNANPAVATSTAHGLTDGTVGYLATATGMESIQGMAAIVDGATANTFELENLNTFGIGTFTAGTFVPVTSWQTLSKMTDYNISGGEADPLDSTVLLDLGRQTEAGLNSSQNCAFTFRSETEYGAAMETLESASRSGTPRIFRITLRDGARRVFRGIPSMPTESLGTGALGSGGFTVAIVGYFGRGSAA